MSRTPRSDESARGTDPIVGIDLGTTNSLVAVVDEAGPRILEVPGSGRLMPSVVRYAGDGSVEAVGKRARDEAVEHAERTVVSVKRLMGRSLADVAADLKHLAYRVVEGANNTVWVAIEHRVQLMELPEGALATVCGDMEPFPPHLISPQEVSAAILRSLREGASAAMGVPVKRAVVTVPAYFDDAQRQATRDAGRLAGLEIVRIVNEPTAAALAYGIGLGETGRPTRAETVAVFDLGGGTFDLSILRVMPEEHGLDGTSNDPGAFFQVLTTQGDTHLGGDDVDRMIFDLLKQSIQEQFGAEAGRFRAKEPELRAMAERVKIALSDEERTTASLAVEAEAGKPALSWSRVVTKQELEALIGPWVERAMVCCAAALRDAKLKASDIDRVVMVGGSTRVPLVRQRVAEFFGAEPYTALNPDEVVALGAAVQASIMAGSTKGMLLLDVVPLSLGIETAGGAVAKIIMRNTSVPARATEMFSTSVDNQTGIKLHVLQGEREMVEDCRSLGRFELKGIPPMPAGLPQVEVEFFVDANGVLDVRAHERRSGKRATLQVVPNYGLTREEVDRMEAESFAHAREDMARHRIADLIANSKLDVKWISDGLARVGEKLDPAYQRELEAGVAQLRAMIESAERDWQSVDPNAFQKAKEMLDQQSVRMHEVSIAASLRESDGASAGGAG